LDKDILISIYDNKSYWEGIKGVRNRLIHEYWGTSIQMIYEISTDEIPEGEAVIARLENDSDEVQRLVEGLVKSKKIRVKENEFIVMYL
ncbi:MAG: HepT-like ribonuclease domain-containing protein, partial [Fusobacteriaceae bacterium]